MMRYLLSNTLLQLGAAPQNDPPEPFKRFRPFRVLRN